MVANTVEVISAPLRISPSGLELVQAFEACMAAIPGQKGRFKPYLDSAGVLTIGWGHTNHGLPRFDASAVWSQQDCDSALAIDMRTFESHVHQLCHVELEQNEFDALVSWSFNTGGPATATLWKKLNAANKAAIPAELAKWNRAGGKVLAGLTRRRKAEGMMFSGDVKGALALAHGS
jgi:lysozyme